MKEKIIKIFIKAQSAESGPPLGTVLGNLGVNSLKFCKDFNEFTNDLPNYFKLFCIIKILENKSFTYTINCSSIGYFLSLLKKEESFVINGQTYVYDILLLSIYLN